MKKPFLFLGTLSALFSLTFLVTSRVNAATTPVGEPYVLKMLATVGYRKLDIAVAGMVMVEPDTSSSGPKLVEWVRAEQARGQAVLVPSGYYEGKMNVSPSQILATDTTLANSMLPFGVFKLLPKV
jgi:hypothetical protein